MNDEHDTHTPNEDVLNLQKKAEAFAKLGTIVHIPFKNGSWKRGRILKVGADFFLLNERKEGEQPVFYFDITDIKVYVTPQEARVK